MPRRCVCVYVCVVCSGGKGRGERDVMVESKKKKKEKLSFRRIGVEVFSKYDICCGAMKGLIISGSDLVESRVWRI